MSGPGGENPTQVTFSMPEVWDPANQFEPEEVRFESAGGLTIHAYLMKPKVIGWEAPSHCVDSRRAHPADEARLASSKVLRPFPAYNQYLVKKATLS